MKKYLAALCAMCLVLLGAALAETDIRLADAGVEAGAGVEVDGSSISIVKGGSYRLTGTMAEGHIAVEADGVELIWDGAQIACSTAAPLSARGDLALTLTENGGTLEDLRRARDMDDDGAAIDAGGKVFVSGAGSLNVTAQAGHGLCAAGLTLEGGALNVLAGENGVHLEAEAGETAFELSGGQLAVEANGIGVYAGGDAALRGGDLRLTSGADGLYVEGALTVSGGAAQVSAGGGAGASSPTAAYYDSFFGYDPFDLFFGSPYYGGYDNGGYEARVYDAVSAAGIVMEDGSLVLDASGDALRADGALTMRGGALSITCGGDGLRAGGDVAVSGGVIWVDECETGLSGADVYLAGGETSVCCSGRSGAPLNAAGEVFADGGTLIAVGGSDESAIAEDSAQAVLRARFNGTLREGVRVVVENEDGQAAFSFEPEADFSRLLLTSPALQQGGTYTLYVEGEALGMATVDGAETYFRGDFTEERDERNGRDERRDEGDGREAQPPMESGAERI